MDVVDGIIITQMLLPGVSFYLSATVDDESE